MFVGVDAETAQVGRIIEQDGIGLADGRNTIEPVAGVRRAGLVTYTDDRSKHRGLADLLDFGRISLQFTPVVAREESGVLDETVGRKRRERRDRRAKEKQCRVGILQRKGV